MRPSLTPGVPGRALLLGIFAWWLTALPLPAWQALEPGYWERTPLPEIGLATYYAPGMMDYVREYRLGHNQLPPCPDCIGQVALLRAGDIGRKVWLQPPWGGLVGPLQVIDCARREDIPSLENRIWVVDVSFELGQTWAMTGPLDNVIVWPDPSENDSPPPTPEPTRFYIDPKDVIISAPTPGGQEVASPAVPTRLPEPPPAPSAETPQPPRPPAATAAPVPTGVTTPTPAGWVAPTPDASRPTATPEPRVALGRPGLDLLNQVDLPAEGSAGRPITGTRHLSSTVFSSPLPGGAGHPGSSTPILPPVSKLPPPPPPVDLPGNGNLFDQLWKALRSLLAR